VKPSGAPFQPIEERNRRALVEAERRLTYEAEGLLSEPGAQRALASASGPRGRGRTARVRVGGVTLRLRPCWRGGLLGPWLGRALWGAERPLAELRVNAELRRRGAPVARPAFAVAWRRVGPWWRAVYATHEERDSRDAAFYLRGAPSRAAVRRALAALGASLRRFHDLGGVHADLNLRNVLIGPDSASPAVTIIDLDRARIAESLTPRRRMRELMRLYRSCLKEGVANEVGIRGAALVFRTYCAGDRKLRRALLEHVARERRRVTRHAWLYPR